MAEFVSKKHSHNAPKTPKEFEVHIARRLRNAGLKVSKKTGKCLKCNDGGCFVEGVRKGERSCPDIVGTNFVVDTKFYDYQTRISRADIDKLESDMEHHKKRFGFFVLPAKENRKRPVAHGNNIFSVFWDGRGSTEWIYNLNALRTAKK
eukprot:TRINITY_DN15615_c0_g1_i1.p1 TRINITY_DN15615_c0_g1~~TRINITY_DN15615_c0_g1_i1.p1  ORF type:complete len:166 (-),score=10.43 TRINITY_DN15615_c0_g1_i1:65-511(-)